MKIIIKDGFDDKVNKFPCLMKARAVDNIFLFFDENNGICLTAIKFSGYKCGEKCKAPFMNLERFEGTIFLSNE